MKNEILSMFQTSGHLTAQEVTVNIVMSAVLGFFIFLSYAISHRGTIYSKKFNASLVVLTVLTGTVMTVIGNNIALSLGMVGALSIVRFRTAIKDSRDSIYIFWTIIVGICCGVGDYMVAAIGSTVTFAVILILGMMIGSAVSAVVQILQYMSHEEALKSFVVWTMGSLGDVTTSQLWLVAPAIIAGLVLSVAVIKPMNLMLLGEAYARTMGLNIRRTRSLILLSTTLLAGTVTAFCGPVGFIGLAIPHLARIIFQEADHRVLLPATALSGAISLLLCDIVSKLLTLPVNTVTALLGIPIVVWVVVRNKNIV